MLNPIKKGLVIFSTNFSLPIEREIFLGNLWSYQTQNWLQFLNRFNSIPEHPSFPKFKYIVLSYKNKMPYKHHYYDIGTICNLVQKGRKLFASPAGRYPFIKLLKKQQDIDETNRLMLTNPQGQDNFVTIDDLQVEEFEDRKILLCNYQPLVQEKSVEC